MSKSEIIDAEQKLRRVASQHPMFVFAKKKLGEARVVIGRGSANPEVLFIGEAPGQTENRAGKPFVGRSGEIIDKWIEKLGKPCALINTVPVIPLDEQGKIRAPSKEEIECFRPYTEALVKALKPKIIIYVGKIAAQLFGGIVQFESGSFSDGKGMIYHPAFFLRNGQDGMIDFLKLLEKINGREKRVEKSIESQYVNEISWSNIPESAAFEKFIDIIGAKKTSNNTFVFDGKDWLVDFHPFDHSDDIIIEEAEAKKHDYYLLFKSSSDRIRIVGWCSREELMSTPPRDIYRNNKNYYIVFAPLLHNLENFKIPKQQKLKEVLIINRQQARELGTTEMTSELIAGLHFFGKQAGIFVKDINTTDELFIGQHKAKIYTRDAKSDDDMLVQEEYFQRHPEIDIYILCKTFRNSLHYIGYITREEVSEMPVVAMMNDENTEASEDIRRIYAQQYKPMSNLIPIPDLDNEDDDNFGSEQPYAPLHVHSEYSIGDAYGTIKQLVKSAKKKGFHNLALTDHGTLGGVWAFQKECLANDIKPIIGCELYVQLSNSERRFHTVALVKNEQGWKNLLDLQAYAVRRNFYYKPIVPFEMLLEKHEGLIITSGCISSPIPTMVSKGLIKDAKELIKKTKAVFSNDFYIELQPHTIDDNQKVMKQLSDIADEMGVKKIITTDSHYPFADDKKYHEAIRAIGFNKKYGEAGYDDECFFLMTDEEFYKWIDEHEQCTWMKPLLPELFKNTMEIASKVNFEIIPPENNSTLPRIKIADIADEKLINEFRGWQPLITANIETPTENDKFLLFLCEKGMKRIGRFGDKKYIDRLRLEAERIISKDYVTYFLIVYELIKWSKQQGIMVGAGRGSVGSSLIALLLNITMVDPIEHNLLFDRFISAVRKDAPDIDMDFQDTRRHEVFDHLVKKYGEWHAAKIITYARFHSKGVMRDVGRIFCISKDEIDKICDLVIVRSGGDARSSFSVLDTFEEFEEAQKFRDKYPEAVDIAIKLEGHIRHRGVHAAGLALTDAPINHYAPIHRINDEIAVEWEKGLIEQMKIVKFDILGLKTLTVLADACHYSGADLPTNFDDENVFKLFREGRTSGIFQFEGTGMTKLAQQIGIKNFKELYHCTSLYRPGALHSGQTAIYVKRARGEEEEKPLHPLLTEITKDTKGLILFQEQIMLIMHDIGNLSWATSEMSRKIMTKSKGAKEFEKIRGEFVQNAVREHNLEEKEAQKLFDVVSTFGSYGFNASHAIEYSMLSYWCAYFKHFFPAAFYAAILRNESESKSIFYYMQEAQKDGIEIEYPHINFSKESYDVHDNKIYAGLTSIIGIAEKTARRIIKLQPFESYEDFVKKAKPSKKILRGLIIADAFRDFGINKKVCYYADGVPKNPYDKLIDDFNNIELTKKIMEHTTLKPKFSIQETFEFDDLPYVNIGELNKEEHGGKQVLMRGLITDVINKDRILRTNLDDHEHKWEKHMFYLNLTDGTGSIAVVIMPHAYTKYQHLIGRLEKMPVVTLVTMSNDAIKSNCDMIKIVGKDDEEFDKTVKALIEKQDNPTVITSATPAVSKNGKSYYRVSFSNGVSGLVFRSAVQLFPGMKAFYSVSKPPFINLFSVEKKKNRKCDEK